MNFAASSSSFSQSRFASALVAVRGVSAGIHADLLKGNLFLLFGIAITGALSRLATLAGMIAALKVIMLAVKHGHLPISIALLMKHLGVESSRVEILILGSGVFIIFFTAWTVSCLSIFLQKYFEKIKIENTLKDSDLLDAKRLGRFESRMSAARTVMRLLEVMFFLILFSSLIFWLSPLLFFLLLLIGGLLASGLLAFNKRRASLLLTKQKLKSKLINTKISHATPKQHCVSSKVKFREKYFNVSSDLRLLAAQIDRNRGSIRLRAASPRLQRMRLTITFIHFNVHDKWLGFFESHISYPLTKGSKNRLNGITVDSTQMGHRYGRDVLAKTLQNPSEFNLRTRDICN